MSVLFILLVIVVTQCCNVVYGLSNNPRHETIIKAPHVGYVNNKSKSFEVYVCGTSHFKCNSATEVTNLIGEVKPDGVVLELDPERVVRLTKQYAGFDQNGSYIGQSTDELIYGVDFASAIETSQKLDIPLFLGDEYAQETKKRLIQDIFNVKKYSPRPLLNSMSSRIKSKEDNADKVRIDILRMFAADPNKLRPLLIAGFPPFLFAVLAFFFDNGTTQEGSGSLIVLEIVVSIVVSFLAVSFLFNTVIVERDQILAASTLQASEVLRSLKDNKSIRKKWSFTVKKEKHG